MAEDTQRFSDGTAYEQFMGRWTRASLRSFSIGSHRQLMRAA